MFWIAVLGVVDLLFWCFYFKLLDSFYFYALEKLIVLFELYEVFLWDFKLFIYFLGAWLMVIFLGGVAKTADLLFLDSDFSYRFIL